MTAAVVRQDKARAPGTNKNRQSAVKEYLRFCYQYRWLPLTPRPYQMYTYIEHLNTRKLAPSTIRNHIGHIRSYMKLADAPPAADHFRISRAIEATMRRKDYEKKEKPSVPTTVITRALAAIPKTEESRAVVAAILMMFYGAFRQSEVVPQTITSFDPQRHLTRADVLMGKDSMTVVIKAAKNLQRIVQRRSATIYSAEDPHMCLLSAIRAVLQESPTVDPRQPMFVFRNSRRPIPASYVRTQWNAAIVSLGLKQEQYTLHSLRKSAMSAVYDSGLTERHVQHYGRWASSAYRAYIHQSEDLASLASWRLLLRHLNPLIINNNIWRVGTFYLSQMLSHHQISNLFIYLFLPTTYSLKVKGRTYYHLIYYYFYLLRYSLKATGRT